MEQRVRVSTERERGSILVQFALVVPILIVVALMAWEIWRVVAVKKAVHMAAYQAARYIASNPKKLQGKEFDQVEAMAIGLVVANLSQNPIVSDYVEDVSIEVSPLTAPWDPSEPLKCGDGFYIIVSIPWRVEMPFLDRVWQGEIASQYDDYIRCRE